VAKLIILVGLPGSGKSSYAENLMRDNGIFDPEVDMVVHSSDAIREELFGDASSQEDNARVFDLMRKRTTEDLRAGKTVIYDATNVTRKGRRSAVACAHPTHDTVECHIVWADPQECVRRDGLRNRTVGPEVIDKMLRRWQSPWKDEGFDVVNVILNQRDFDQVKYIAGHTDSMHMPHNNPHHQLGIWDHCMQAYYNLEQGISCPVDKRPTDYHTLVTAAMWHDIGKPWTKCFKLNKETGDLDTSVTHYYDHHCVGGYLSYGLFLNPRHSMWDDEIDDICFISWMISNHMEPFFDSHYYRDLDPHLKWYIDVLHAADLAAH
jgi:predicted kinase